jgi:alkylated DNA repair dioxygenase AlkB
VPPEGFRYEADVLPPDEELKLVEHIRELPHALVTEYGPGAAIGWHRDKGVFDEVIGISLLSPCNFRFRRKTSSGWERYSLTVEPRSAYLLQGAARTEWEHNIPGVESIRYSITFRRLRARY